MNPEKKDIIKWVKALRSGKYKQTREALQDKDGYCCLGVACKEFIISKDLIKFNDGTMVGGSAASQPKVPNWLKSINYSFAMEAGPSLIALNDSHDYKLSFNEIADCLEAVYIHEVLDA